MPVHIGYLKTLGLDYGWGPTAIMEWLVEHVHVYAGTPWWLSISLAIVGIRFAVLRAYMAAADTSARLQGVRSVTAPITEEMLKEQRAGNQVGVMQLRQKLKLVHQRAGIQTWKAFVPMTQVFIGFGTFRLMRGMSSLPVPGLETGGVLWFQDLTLADPYMILPVTTAIMTVIVMKSANGGYALMAPAIQKALTYGLPVVTLVVMLPWPAALQLSFVISTMFSLAQSLLLRSVLFRRWAGITPMPPPPTTPSSAAGDSPYMGSLNLGTSAKRVIGVSATSSPATPPKKVGGLSGIVDKAVSDMKGARDELTKQVQKYSGSSDGGNKKAAEAYEKRRSVEEAQRRRDEAQARRQRLLAKRAAKAKQSER